MKSIKQAVGFGFLAWLVPFVVSVSLFPLKRAGDPLFDTAKGVVVVRCAVILVSLYFQNLRGGWMREGIVLGMLWMLISLVLDGLMFSHGPMLMPVGAYLKDIGLAYLILPVISTGAGWMLQTPASAPAVHQGV